MNKGILLLLVTFLFAGTSSVFAAPAANLNDQMNDLKLPENLAPQGVTKEKLYAAQSRYEELSHRFELDVGGSKNFTGDSFLSMSQLDMSLRYFINDRMYVSASGSYGFNSFTDSAQQLINVQGIVPDAAIVKWRTDALFGYNLFYGKFRVSMDQVFYFDQYVAIGPGLITTQFDTSPSAVADIGFALWFGNNFSARFGAKNDVFSEKKLTDTAVVDHLLGYLSIGYVFGKENHYE